MATNIIGTCLCLLIINLCEPIPILCASALLQREDISRGEIAKPIFSKVCTLRQSGPIHITLLRQRSRCKINQQALGSEAHLHLKHLIFLARLPAKAGGGTFALSSARRKPARAQQSDKMPGSNELKLCEK